MAKSWLYGAATVVLAHALWLSLILTQAHFDWVMPVIVMMLLVMINIAGIAAFITALKAPRDPLLLALTMAPLTALLAIAGNQLLVLTGTHLDFAGTRGSDGLFAVALGYGIFVSVIGGVLGAWLAKRRAAEIPVQTAIVEAPSDARAPEPVALPPTPPAPMEPTAPATALAEALPVENAPPADPVAPADPAPTNNPPPES